MTVEWPQITFLVSLMLAWSGLLIGVIRWLIANMLSDLKQGITDDRKELARIQAELTRLQTEMPIYYERREDAIRAYAVINAKLDRLFELQAGIEH